MTLEDLEKLIDKNPTVKAIVHAMSLRERDMTFTNAKTLLKEMRELGYKPSSSDMALAFTELTKIGLCTTKRQASSDGTRHYLKVTWAKQWPPSSWVHLGAQKKLLAQKTPLKEAKETPNTLMAAMAEYLEVTRRAAELSERIKKGL